MPLSVDWQPLVAAVAAFVALQGVPVATLLLVIANRAKVADLHHVTDGTLSQVAAQVAALQAQVELLRDAQLAAGKGPDLP